MLKEWSSYKWAIFTALHVGQKSKDNALLQYLSGPEKGRESALAVPSQGSKDSWGTILQGVEVAHVYAALATLPETERALASYLYGPRQSDREISLLQNYGWQAAADYQGPDPKHAGPRGGYEHAVTHVVAVKHGMEAYRRAAVNETRHSHSEAATALGISRALYYRKNWNECLDALYDAYEALNGSTLRHVAKYFNAAQQEVA